MQRCTISLPQWLGIQLINNFWLSTRIQDVFGRSFLMKTGLQHMKKMNMMTWSCVSMIVKRMQRTQHKKEMRGRKVSWMSIEEFRRVQTNRTMNRMSSVWTSSVESMDTSKMMYQWLILPSSKQHYSSSPMNVEKDGGIVVLVTLNINPNVILLCILESVSIPCKMRRRELHDHVER